MSYWTYVRGFIEVTPMGRTQAEVRYILDTVLSHLPLVTGSERDMSVHVIQKNGRNESSSHNEFGQWIPREWHEMQRNYLLIVEGNLRDRLLEQTKREFLKWLCRLAKRVFVEDILVRISGFDGSVVIDDEKPFYEMFEDPSWIVHEKGKEDSVNWCEYLMWDRAKDSDYPLKLAYKYIDDPENDAEFQRRREYARL